LAAVFALLAVPTLAAESSVSTVCNQKLRAVLDVLNPGRRPGMTAPGGAGLGSRYFGGSLPFAPAADFFSAVPGALAAAFAPGFGPRFLPTCASMPAVVSPCFDIRSRIFLMTADNCFAMSASACAFLICAGILSSMAIVNRCAASAPNICATTARSASGLSTFRR